MSETYKDMESSELKQLNFKMVLVALLCLCGVGAGSYFLYKDFTHSGGAGQGKPMAKVERRESKVRRKSATSYAWNNVQSEESLFRRDSVQTSAGSAAAIRFNDGSMLELGENSLVVIDDITNLSLDFLKGSVVLHTAEGDKRVTVGKDGKARFEELPIRLIKPEPLARFFTREQEAKPVHFSWMVRGTRAGQENALPASYALQLSSERGFRGAHVQTLAIKDGKILELDAKLPPGSYFWRLVAGEKALTEGAQFRVISAAPLRPVWPISGEKILSYGDQVPVQFRWLNQDEASVAGGVEHELQIARDPEFKTRVSAEAVSATRGIATVKDLPDGDLYWRIGSRYADIQVYSPVEKFTIGKATRPTLALIQPEDKKTLELGSQIRMGWRSDAEGIEYQVEIQTPQGKPMVSERSRTTAFVWKKPEAGAFRWRVSAFHKDHNVGETPWRGFAVFEGARITLRAPTRDQEILYWEKPIPFVFKWEEDVLAVRHSDYSYQVVAAHDAEFKEPVLGPKTRDLFLASEKLSLAPGSYYWKVQVVDASGQTIKSSDSFKFVYNVFPVLGAPVALTPEPAAVFNLVEQEKNPVVTWGEVKEAEAYEVTLYAAPPSRDTASGSSSGGPPGTLRVVSRTVTTKTSNEFKKLQPANYQWSIRAIDRLKRKGAPMSPRGFSITYGEVLQSPEVITPEVQ